MEIHGDSGAIVIGDAMTQDTAGTVTLHTAAGIEPIEIDTSADLYQINVRAFVQAIQGQGQPTASGTDGLSALQVALAAEQSLNSGCTVEIANLR